MVILALSAMMYEGLYFWNDLKKVMVGDPTLFLGQKSNRAKLKMMEYRKAGQPYGHLIGLNRIPAEMHPKAILLLKNVNAFKN